MSHNIQKEINFLTKMLKYFSFIIIWSNTKEDQT